MSYDVKNLLTRITIAVIAVPVLLWIVLTGGYAIAAFALVLTLIGSWEWVRIARLEKMRGLAALSFVGPFALLVLLWFGLDAWWSPALVIFTLTAFILAITGQWETEGAIRTVGGTVVGIVYVGLFGLMIPISRGIGDVVAQDGQRLIATAFVIVWMTDSFAYFGGSSFGRHRLAPRVSPKKSWEGAIAGFFGGILGALLGRWIFGIDTFGLVEIGAFGAVVGVLGQVGDLAESIVKRDAGIKDSSSLIPGHGGVLDRFDSFLFTLAIIWIWLYVRSVLTAA